MKNRKRYIIIGILVIVILIIITSIFFIKRNKLHDSNTSILKNNINKTSNGITIKSTASQPIKKDDIEVSSIEITKETEVLSVKTIIKNHMNKNLNGFYIEIHLLDKGGNLITLITKNTNEQIKANDEYILNSSIVGNDVNIDNIASAKIESLVNSTIENNIDNTFNEMLEEGR